MSEVESKTAGVIETSQNENPSLLKRARGVLDNSAFGKFIGGAMIVGAVAGATREAAADAIGDAIVCSTEGKLGNGQMGPYFVIDRLQQGTEKDIAVWAPGASSEIYTIGEDIYSMGGETIGRYSRNLDRLSTIEGASGVKFIEGSDVLYQTSSGKFYRINEGQNGLTELGGLDSSIYQNGDVINYPLVNSMVSDGQNIFITSVRDTTGELIISTISPNQFGNEPIAPSVKTVDSGAIQGRQGKPFIDETTGEIIIPYQKNTGAYGYGIVSTGDLQLKSFKEVDTKGRRIDRGCVGEDAIYLLTEKEAGEADVIVRGFDGRIVYTHTVNPKYSTTTSDPMKKLQDGGVVLTEEGSRFHTIIKQSEITRIPQGDSLLEYEFPVPFDKNIIECAVLSDLCKDVHPDDGNVCTIDECDSVTGETIHISRTGESCDDGDACTEGDECNSEGVCEGSSIELNEDACTKEICDSVTGVKQENKEDNTECDNGDGTCQVGVCTPNTIPEDVIEGDVADDVYASDDGVVEDDGVDADDGVVEDDGVVADDVDASDDGVDADDRNSQGETGDIEQGELVKPQDANEPDAFAEGDGGGGSGCNTNGKGSPEGMIPVAALGIAVLMRKRLEEWWKSVTKPTANSRD